MCLFTNPSELCNHPECIRHYFSQYNTSTNNGSLIANINALIQQHSIALNDLTRKNNTLNQNLDTLTQELLKKTKIPQSNIEEPFSLEGIFRWISSGKTFSLFITLLNSFPDIIYKEKGFHVQVNVTDSNGSTVILPNSFTFIIALFTMENPPKLLKRNISGKKILRGTSEAIPEDDGIIHFRNVVVNEVTSHYPNDSFCLVILCPSLSHVKPLATSGISVRARKHNR
ncbi:hypothetical protein SteCoe_12811 [Stentor coeruleus]|uniref:Uncharacterized protein n=1 Tax=Stentor coeruleus TaxID=5963 RepID=A0A1R2CA23_9CILI|nr:hypothetical protein SteCoe_12811 [Stentor coeruleus]